MNISKDFLTSVAPNDAALRNGESLVKKHSFSGLVVSCDGSYVGGLCAGSGSSPYACSVDFIDPAAPVFRCSCPSRQFPCKHVLGLLYAYTEGRTFEQGDIPADILDKRRKKEQRVSAKPKENETPPKDTPARKRSALKKIEAQCQDWMRLKRYCTTLSRPGWARWTPGKRKACARWSSSLTAII